ncbi:MAG: hypothetical protein IPJ40_17900 [Saprospirales bacterium]|nr:hypothetical protein [Saprospirales bacterium]
MTRVGPRCQIFVRGFSGVAVVRVPEKPFLQYGMAPNPFLADQDNRGIGAMKIA